MVGVTDMDRSVAFYRDRVGLNVKFQIPGFTFLDAGSLTLVLSEPHAKACEDLVGATEIVFGVDGVSAEYTRLTEQGVKFANEPKAATETDWTANFTDPDGHRLSLFGPLE